MEQCKFNLDKPGAIIKQFILLLLDYRENVGNIDNRMWSIIMHSVLNRMRRECYLFDDDGIRVYGFFDIMTCNNPDDYSMNSSVLLNPKLSKNEIQTSEIIVDVNNKKNVVNYIYYVTKKHPNPNIRRFSKVALKYCNVMYNENIISVFSNLVMTYTLINIFNDEVINTYYTVSGLASYNINDSITELSMMRSSALNVFCDVLSEFNSDVISCVDKINDKLNHVIPEDVRVTGYIHFGIACHYNRDNFEYDGRDIFRCDILPCEFTLAVERPTSE